MTKSAQLWGVIVDYNKNHPCCLSKQIHEGIGQEWGYPIDYKKAMLIFYEQNNISVFKKIFIDQFEFAVRTYF